MEFKQIETELISEERIGQINKDLRGSKYGV